jgi:phenylacetic acid degradation operon negative regulatory protein
MMLSFLGLYLRAREVAVSTGSLIEVFRRGGVGEEAVRSTVTRMVQRDLLGRHRQGRKLYVGLTPRSSEVLADGHRRMWEEGAVNRSWDGTWTVVAFTLPDERRSDRHELRSKLHWAGFGPLQGGLWIAAGHRDVASVLGSLDLDGHLVVLGGETLAPTEPGEIVARGFDTTEIARGYDEFLAHWADPAEPGAGLPDDLARQLLLHTDWLSSVRRDPHLPAQHLPADWPAIRAERVFRSLAETWRLPAAREAEEVLDLLEL